MSKKHRFTVATHDGFYPEPCVTITDDFSEAMAWLIDAVRAGHKVSIKARSVK